MKMVDIADATDSLSEYARRARRGTLVVTRRGKPVAAVVPIQGVDLERLALSHSPGFVEILKRSWAGYQEHGGISLEEIERELVPRKPARPRKLTRRPA